MTTQNNKSVQTNANHLVVNSTSHLVIRTTAKAAFLKNTFFVYFAGMKKKIKGNMKYISLALFITIASSQLSNAQLILTTGDNNNSTCNIDDWTALKAIYENTNGDNWKKRNGWDTMIDGQNNPSANCNLNNLEGVSLNVFGRIEALDLNFTTIHVPFNPEDTYCDLISIGGGNNLRGDLPQEIGLLEHLKFLDLGNNYLTGTLPVSLSNLNNLEALFVNDNDITGTIPDMPNLTCLNITANLFVCNEVEQYINNHSNQNIEYSPQYAEHSYEPFIVDPDQVNNFTINFPLSADANYYWERNGNLFDNPSTEITFSDIQQENAGKYSFHISDVCVPDLEIIRKPIYIIYPGYDLEGEPVVANQIMVEFDNAEDSQFFENEILLPNGGFVASQCNCNRELYLWEFPNEEATALAIIEIDATTKVETIDDDDAEEIDGGFNNILNVGAIIQPNGVNYIVPSVLDPNQNYNDEVNIFMLDTGLDNSSCIDNNYADETNISDACYNNNSNIDDNGHGTIGYNLISDGLGGVSNVNISSLKVFNEEGQGNLYDLVCAIYYSIDNNANVINISAGFYGEESSILTKAVNTAREQQVFICTAAGNEGYDIDTLIQYPAGYAGMFHYEYDEQGVLIDSVRYSNVISIAALNLNRILPNYSNRGENSVTMACYGHNLTVNGIDCNLYKAKGTSFSTFIVSRFLALEIAKDNSRNLSEIWADFEQDKLKYQNYLVDKTITGKRLNIGLLMSLSSSRIGNSGNQIITKNTNAINLSNTLKNDNIIETNLINSYTNNAYLQYKSFESGTFSIDLYDTNGRLVKKLNDGYVNKNEQNQIYISSNMLMKGLYYININFKLLNGAVHHKVIQFPAL